MEAQNRRSDRDLIAEVRSAPHRFRFFQTVRMLSLAQGGEKRGLPANLRFRTPANLVFPASEQTALRTREPLADDQPAHEELEVGFLGLNGPSGVLPHHYTELMQERRTHFRDTGMHEFFDIFNHRSLALFYSAWRKYRFWAGFEAGERDGFSRNLMDMAGVGLSKLGKKVADDPSGVPDLFFMRYAGLLAQKPLSCANLESIVRGFLDVPVVLEQFVGEWINLPESEQIKLGQQGCALGVDTFSGQRIWERQNKLRLRIGPLDQKQFSAFLPGAPASDALAALMRFALGHTLACDVTLVLSRDAIAPSRMDQNLMLGFNTWAAGLPAECDSDDVHYTLLQ